MEELKRNREAREAIKEDLEMIARDQDRSGYSDWKRTEDRFHLNQAKLRSTLRIRESRAKPIDLLARYIGYRSDKTSQDEEFELIEPLSYFIRCSISDLEDLVEDVKVSQLYKSEV